MNSGQETAWPVDPEDPAFAEQLANQVELALHELLAAGKLGPGALIVFGVSTSEVAGRPIGTAGSLTLAAGIFEGMQRVRAKTAFYPIFQCCEHLNRALVVERELLSRTPGLTPVSVIPVRKAGGAMAAYAYRELADAVVVEAVQADAGIDIGATLIGMHLRPVAVPLRPSERMVGHAPLLMAYSRPKLIGGPRAVYSEEAARGEGGCD